MNLTPVSGDKKVEAQNPGDIWLMEQIAAGDEEAFSELYHRHHEQIYNYLLRLVRESSGAEDLLQEVFVAVWQGAGRFRKESKVRTWIFRIAHHKAVSWLRRLRPVDALPAVLPGSSPEWNPEARSIRSWQVERIQAALEQLSPKHRSVVELAYVNGFSYQEIGKILRCPVGTVKSRMSYAIRQLQGVLQVWGLKEDLILS